MVAAMCQLAYGFRADATDEYCRLGKTTTLKALKDSCTSTVKVLALSFYESPIWRIRRESRKKQCSQVVSARLTAPAGNGCRREAGYLDSAVGETEVVIVEVETDGEKGMLVPETLHGMCHVVKKRMESAERNVLVVQISDRGIFWLLIEALREGKAYR